MHTEEEAKEKWCPEHRATSVVVRSNDAAHMQFGVVNSYYDPGNWIQHPTSCIGSACMHWRWAPPVMERVETNCYTQDGAEENKPAGEGWKLQDGKLDGYYWERPLDRRGFCGLSGIPG